MKDMSRTAGPVAVVLILLVGAIAATAVAQPVEPISSEDDVAVPERSKSDVALGSLQTAKPREELSIIEARFGALDSWVDVTYPLCAHIKQGGLQLPSLKPVLENVKDPAIGHRKTLVVVYRQGDEVRMKLVPTDGVEDAWGSLILPERLELLVVGNHSDNIVRFDMSTGQASVVAKLDTGSHPRSIAVNRLGEIFVGLSGGKKNIVRLVPNTAGGADRPLLATDLTGAIGRYGPGLMAFDRYGLLNVAGDTNRSVQRYSVATGELVQSIPMRGANLVGLTVAGDVGYAAEYFQNRIVRFDLAADSHRGQNLIDKTNLLDRPHGMTIGHNGNLFVSSLRNNLIQEFQSGTGQFISTFLDVRTIGGDQVKDLHYEPRLKHYLLSSGDTVYELSMAGELRAKFQCDSLTGAGAFAITSR